MYDDLSYLDGERLVTLNVLMRQKMRQKEGVAKAYNKKVKSKTFSFGDLVCKVILSMDKKDRTLGKWSPNWEGAFKVLQAYTHNAYEVEELTPEGRIQRINGKYLKQYIPIFQEIHIDAE